VRILFNWKSAVLAIVLLGLTGCFGPKPEEELYTIFENAAKQEKEMHAEASKLEALEKKNQEMYTKIVQEGKENNQSVMPVIDEVMKNAKERGEILNKEQSMLQLAQDKMKEAEGHINNLKDVKLKKQAQEVENLYKARYKAFENVHEDYKKALDTEKSLYNMLQQKNEKIKTISDQVKEVNKQYSKVQQENEKFNEYTKQYNKEKITFYKLAKFKIKEDK
jgi:myosin heavy subunit